MTRFSSVVAIVSVVVFAAACADGTTAIPSSSLRPAGQISAAGNPPPPPLTGRGDGELAPDFDEEFSSAASVDATRDGGGKSALVPCDLPAFVSLSYSFDYMINKPDKNAFVHLDPDNQKQITIHQNGDKLDAHGTIIGAGFTFAITDVTDGSIIGDGEGGRVLDSFFLRITGIVTHADGSKCQAAAILDGGLGGSDSIGN